MVKHSMTEQDLVQLQNELNSWNDEQAIAALTLLARWAAECQPVVLAEIIRLAILPTVMKRQATVAPNVAPAKGAN